MGCNIGNPTIFLTPPSQFAGDGALLHDQPKIPVRALKGTLLIILKHAVDLGNEASVLPLGSDRCRPTGHRHVRQARNRRRCQSQVD